MLPTSAGDGEEGWRSSGLRIALLDGPLDCHSTSRSSLPRQNLPKHLLLYERSTCPRKEVDEELE
jgi:hypothetical protein